jgi:hypothetical protein
VRACSSASTQLQLRDGCKRCKVNWSLMVNWLTTWKSLFNVISRTSIETVMLVWNSFWYRW